MPQPKYQLRRCSGYRRPMASGAAASRSDSEPASGASRELVRVWEGQAGSANRFLPSRAHFQWRRFSLCRRCLASGTASSRGAAQSATRAPPRYSPRCRRPCQIIVGHWPCRNPCVLRKNHDGDCLCAYHDVMHPDGFPDTVMEYTRLARPVSVCIQTYYLVLTAWLLMCMLYSLGSSFGVTVVGLRSCMDEEPLEYAVGS